ncbi:MAG: rhodanese-like domain-containing protein [Bacteroidota bacterium]
MRTVLLISSLFLFAMGCKSKTTNASSETTFKDVNVSEAKTMIAEKKDLVILDVRTPEETAQGIIEGAMIIDIHDPEFDKKINILNKEKPYLVYCRSGGRSVTASNKMIEAGFKDIFNLEGGYRAWSK